MLAGGSDRVLPNVEEPILFKGPDFSAVGPAMIAINRHLSDPDRALTQPSALRCGSGVEAGSRSATMLISLQDRLGVFIDGADLLSASRALGFSVDFKRLLSLFQQRGKLMRTIFYAALSEDDKGECSMRPLVDWLQYNGYYTSTKSTKRGFGGQPLANGAMDVELAVDALRLARALDHVVLFSGRVELKALVSALQEEGKHVTIVSSLANGAPVADEMRRQADQYVDLAELKDQIKLPAPRRGTTT